MIIGSKLAPKFILGLLVPLILAIGSVWLVVAGFIGWYEATLGVIVALLIQEVYLGSNESR